MITYEKITEADYDILTECMREAFNEDTRMHTELEKDGPWGYADGSLIRLLNTKEGYISEKICVDGVIVGAYTIVPGTEAYTLEMLFLHPQRKCKGMGLEVWKHMEENYANAEKWVLETPDYSKRNHHFYEKCGFHFEKENVYEDGSKSWVFVKESPKRS